MLALLVRMKTSMLISHRRWQQGRRRLNKWLMMMGMQVMRWTMKIVNWLLMLLLLRCNLRLLYFWRDGHLIVVFHEMKLQAVGSGKDFSAFGTFDGGRSFVEVNLTLV